MRVWLSMTPTGRGRSTPHGSLFGLRRPRRGDSSQWEYFKNSSALIASYAEADLEYLMAALARWTPTRQTSSISMVRTR